MTVRNPDRWRKGDRLSVARLNQTVDGVRDLIGGVAPPGERAGSIVPYPVIQHLEIVRVEQDALICYVVNTIDNATANVGDVEVSVVKPYLLRGTLATRNGINYVYTVVPEHTERTATRVSDSATETQVIVPSYSQGDRIFAVRPIFGGTGRFDINGNPIRYLDLNIDARAWAKKAT